ncbi:NAD(P)/FAD-dependent oxidoreductase [Actinophytocola gossypii]|uniref:FAD-binding oxidoreductase n=1 Tax=Actinophytocola gossypii TaxID=2812003 RepID=A0ABT2J8H0_9PSEU|nr:FAD-dependent oxidoreductase [Actinophytocola gossypii]MCT2584160.1 FAD-binding oxidoreductase [Actinophytocola gossypii]
MERVDILVIGGGMAGVSVAYELAADASVLLAEAEPTLAAHTTGRSAAVYAPSYGGPVVRDLTAASAARYRELETELDTPPLLTPRDVLWLAADDEAATHLAGLPATPVTPAEARTLCPVLAEVVAAAHDTSGSDIDVMALHQAYVRGLRARGGRIRTGRPLTALRRDGTGWHATLDTDDVLAGTVVNAAGAWADTVAALAGVPAAGLRPLRRTVALAAGPTPVDPAWPMVADAADRFYFRPEGTRVLVSPADETPTEPCDARPEELDVALALDRVNAVTTLGLRSVHTAWAGLRTFTADRAPVVGAWPDHPGFVFVAGQGGYGIQLAPALAVLAAAVVRGATPPAGVSPR